MKHYTLFYIGFLEIKWTDILDVLLVSVLLYNLYNLVKGGIAFRVLIGFIALYLLYLFVQSINMKMLSNVLGQFMNLGMLALIILFQQELRRFLSFIGERTKFGDFQNLLQFLLRPNNQEEVKWDVKEIVEGLSHMSKQKIGALLVCMKEKSFNMNIKMGVSLDAKISSDMLISIFWKDNPLHDGAVIISDNKILAARCILPVSENTKIPSYMGLRHRAAIGLTEVSSPFVIIVSEETGRISTAQDGNINYNVSLSDLEGHIHKYLDIK